MPDSYDSLRREAIWAFDCGSRRTAYRWPGCNALLRRYIIGAPDSKLARLADEPHRGNVQHVFIPYQMVSGTPILSIMTLNTSPQSEGNQLHDKTTIIKAKSRHPLRRL